MNYNISIFKKIFKIVCKSSFFAKNQLKVSLFKVIKLHWLDFKETSFENQINTLANLSKITMIFRRISSICKPLQRQIHIHKEVIQGSKPGQIIIAHGMLGSSGNWSSLSRRIAKETGQSVTIFDARNHGMSQHTKSMSYPEMSEDMKSLIQGDKVTLIGHSMGGRTAMYTGDKNY